MSKALIRVGYNDYVMDISDAVTLMEIMSKAENYKTKTDYSGPKPNTTAYYIWEQEPTNRDSVTISLMPDAVYRVAKLAGKPQD
jgi:hypothetical protein